MEWAIAEVYGESDAPLIVDPSQNNATMVELNQSDTYLAELDNLNNQESWNDIILDEPSWTNTHLDELNKLVRSSELVRPPELVWSPDFQPLTMIVSYVQTSEDSRPKVFYQSKDVQERLGLIIFTPSTK